jgi:hypothetical protein
MAQESERVEVEMVQVEMIQGKIVRFEMVQGGKLFREMVLEKRFTVKWLKKVKGLKYK